MKKERNKGIQKKLCLCNQTPTPRKWSDKSGDGEEWRKWGASCYDRHLHPQSDNRNYTWQRITLTEKKIYWLYLNTREKFRAWVVWIKEDSVTIFSPNNIDSTRSMWMSMDWTGIADASTVNSPTIGSESEHWVHIFPVTRKPPVQRNG